ncbi:MAG: aryl-sulfate sulfotransferase [Planctomycetota bacterium]
MFWNRRLPAVALFVASSSLLTAQTVFPTGTTIHDSSASDGHTLFSNPNGEAVLIDMDGTVLHTWASPLPGEHLGLIKPLPKGHLLGAVHRPGSQQWHTAVELDWNGKVVWAYYMDPAAGYIHHDLERLPNGNTLILGAQRLLAPQISPVPVLDDFILEVDPDGNPVWIWETWQHFDEFGFDSLARQLISAQAGDWAHTNAVSVIPRNKHGRPELRRGNLIVSQRYTNRFFIIDKATGNIVWQNQPNIATLGQHAPYMISGDDPGAGNIMVFDNGAGTGYPMPSRTAPGFSRVLEINPASKTIAWQYDASRSGFFSRVFFDDIVCNAQRLRNGNTLICSGVRGRLFEVTPSGAIAWEYMSPFYAEIFGPGSRSALLYRAYRVPTRWAGDLLEP